METEAAKWIQLSDLYVTSRVHNAVTDTYSL